MQNPNLSSTITKSCKQNRKSKKNPLHITSKNTWCSNFNSRYFNNREIHFVQKHVLLVLLSPVVGFGPNLAAMNPRSPPQLSTPLPELTPWTALKKHIEKYSPHISLFFCVFLYLSLFLDMLFSFVLQGVVFQAFSVARVPSVCPSRLSMKAPFTENDMTS